MNRYDDMKQQAVEHCKGGRFDAAEPLLLELLDVLIKYGGAIKSSDTTYWFLVAQYKGDTRKAMETLSRLDHQGALALIAAARPKESATMTAAPLDPALKDPRFESALALLTGKLEFARQDFFQGLASSTPEQRSEAIAALLAVRAAHPASPHAHAACAFALEVDGKAMSAVDALEECAASFPACWELDLMLKRDWIWVANPLKLPVFERGAATIHPAINANLISSILVLTRFGALPRTVLFLKDEGGDFNAQVLANARAQFTTMISPVCDPQLVAVMGRIDDNPANPFRLEDIEAPFRQRTEHRRVTMEFFIRQADFDFVVVDTQGRVIHSRVVSVSARMDAVHQELRSRFDAFDGGTDISLATLGKALAQHQSQVDPRNAQY